MKIPDGGAYYREGIKTWQGVFGVYETCDKHAKMWREGAELGSENYRACKRCVTKAQKVLSAEQVNKDAGGGE